MREPLMAFREWEEDRLPNVAICPPTIETIFRSETGHVEIYRRPDGQARLVLRKPGFTGNVRVETRDIDDKEIAAIIEAAKEN